MDSTANPSIGTDVTINETGTAQDGTTTLGLNLTPAAGGITLSPTTGEITVDPGTSAGDYVFTYEICEVVNTNNCDTATVSFAVDPAPINAINDAPSAFDGATGATIPNVVANDTLNSTANPAIGTDVTLNQTGTAQDGTTTLGLDLTPAAGGITLDPATGEITVDPGTTAGTYVYTYEICEVINPTNCSTAEVTVLIDPTPIDAIDDAPPAIDGETGATIPNIVANDTLNSTANPNIGTDVTITETGTAQDGTTTLGLDTTPAEGSITLDPATGEITVAPGTTSGAYVYTYEICEVLNATSCDTAEVSIVIDLTPVNVIDAINDAPSDVDGAAGATIPNIVANDTLDSTANPGIGTEVTITETGTAQDGTTTLGLDLTPAEGGITLNPANGEITVDPGTTAGTYVYTYEICEVVNPTNCDTATVTVVVIAPEIDLIEEIEEDLAAVLGENLANTLAMQSQRISSYAADAGDRLRSRSHGRCLADVNARLAVENILFDTDLATIKPQSHRTLDEIAMILGSCPGSAYEIAGHTDSDASDAYNIDLSQRRVVAVLHALTARGVNTEGYIARGYGESQPIASNATEAGKARNRRVEFRSLDGLDGYQAPCDGNFSLVRGFDAQANGNGVTAQGQFLRDNHDCVTDRREVIEGSLSFSDMGQGQKQSAIDLSYRREQYRGSDSVFGYFVGLYSSQSDVSGQADGEISGLGLNAGIYGANRLLDQLFLDYYLGAAVGQHKFDLDFAQDIGVISATGNYRYFAGFAGAAISGELDMGETTLTPRIGFDYVYAPGADVDVIAEFGSLSQAGELELDAISGGRIFGELRTDWLIHDGQANLWFNPRISCYQTLGNLDGVCGYGASIGLESTTRNDGLTYGFELDGEWGQDYALGALRMTVTRDLRKGYLKGDANLTSQGEVTVGGSYQVDF